MYDINDYTINVELDPAYDAADAAYFARAVAFVLAAEAIALPLEVSLRIVDDATIQTYNRDYLGHDRPTDVIAFGVDEQVSGHDQVEDDQPIDDPDQATIYNLQSTIPYWAHEDTQVDPHLASQQAIAASKFVLPPAEKMEAEGDIPYLGDIIASYETAATQAADYGHTPLQELTELVMHGTLHLLGYDDHDPAGYRVMHQREDRHLAAFLEQGV